MLVGTTVKMVSAPPIRAPRFAVLPFLAANTRSIKSRAIMSPRANAKNPPQFISAPLATSKSPDRSMNSGGALLMMVARGVPENPPAKNRNAAQNAPMAMYTWNRLVYADANSPPAAVYASTTSDAISIPQK